MAETAAERVYKRKQIDLIGIKINVPVVYVAKFKCMNEQAQEYWFYFDNSSDSSRKVHVKDIAAPVGTTTLSVERIDEFHITDMPSQGQQSTFFLTNRDPPPIQPDGSNNPSHEKTHVVRYFPNNTEGQTWIDVELIDELKIKDTVSQAQEWIYYIRHPELGDVIDDPSVPYTVTKGYCDPSFELAPDDSANGIDPPWRLDPLQNIINFNIVQSVTVSWGIALDVSTSSLATTFCTPITTTIPPDGIVIGSWNTILTLNCGAATGVPEGFSITGSPVITPSTTTLDDYMYLNSWLAGADHQTDGSASYHIKASAILGNAPGCYGEEGGSGLSGIGYWVSPPDTVEVASGSIDASGISLFSGPTEWVVSEITITGGATTYNPDAFYVVTISFAPPP